MKVPTVTEIYLASGKGQPMVAVLEAHAIADCGLQGDRYARAEGSWNEGRPGKRQVTFVDAALVACCCFVPEETRRNVVTSGVDLNALADSPGKRFRIGGALFAAVKYCTPCDRVSELAGRRTSFREVAEKHRAGGLIAEVILNGTFAVGDDVVLID